MTAVLTRVGFEVCGLERVDIQVEPHNERSLRIPRRLGFSEDGVLRRRLEPMGDDERRRDSILFTMIADELPASSAMRVPYRAFDVLGRPIDPSR